MPLQTGTHDLAFLLSVRHQTVEQFGVEALTAAITRELGVHNGLMQDALSSLCHFTTDRTVTQGGSAAGEMIEADEYARVPTQTTEGHEEFGLPLRGFQYGIGWTRQWMQRSTPADMAIAVQNAEIAHRRRVLFDIKRALYPATNYNFTGYIGDDKGRLIKVKRLLNGDGMGIPMGPYGGTFDGATHSHYDAIDFNAASTAQRGTALKALGDDVMEHGYTQGLQIVIHRSDVERVKTAEGFIPLVDPRLNPVPGEATEPLDIFDPDNTQIGYIGAAMVVTKPWAVPNYAAAYASGVPSEQLPLAFRQEDATTLQGLQVLATIEAYPLQAEYMGANFGIGAKERANGAVLYLGGGVYVSPTDAQLR